MIRRALILLLLTPSLAFGLGAGDLVGEAERLYQQLGAQDPEKNAVALRLADLMFDAAVEIDGNAKSGPSDMKTADQYRAKAASLYEMSLPKARGASAFKIKFQLARLYALTGKMEAAKRFWRDLAVQNSGTQIRRESALHLAEQLELSNQTSSIREAGELYRQALKLSDKTSLHSYIQYRLAWTEFRLGNFKKSVENLRLSLKGSEARDRSELLKDLVLFMSREDAPASSQIGILSNYEKQYDKPGLIAALADAYQAADKRKDYVLVLSQLNERAPTLEAGIAILDAGQDGWTDQQVLAALRDLNRLKAKGAKFSAEAVEKKSREQLFRLVMLWDGQRKTSRKGSDALFDQGVDTTVTLFPFSEEAKKAMGGWMAANSGNPLQLQRLDQWIRIAQSNKNLKLEADLRKNKLEIARKNKMWDVVVAESKNLENLEREQSRPVRYQRAKALYELKKYDEALPVFEALAQEKVAADEIQKFSQDLTLDILGQQKRYDYLLSLIGQWKKSDARGVELGVLEKKVRFESAVARQDPQSLTEFAQWCASKEFVPQSCDNAKSLAIRFQDQDRLIALLKDHGKESELIQQLEVAGRFVEAAQLLEKKLAAMDRLSALKVALLYEIAGDNKSRDRVLKVVIKKSATAKAIPLEEQRLLFETYKDADLLASDGFSLPWADELKNNVNLEVYAKTRSARARAELLKQCEPFGDLWNEVQLAALKEINTSQAKIQFLGQKSRSRFESRVTLLKKLATSADCFNKGASPELRWASSREVSQAFAEFAQQIAATPIPEGLDEATVDEVKAQIAAMAKPFETSSEQWRQLAEQEISQVSEDQRPILQNAYPEAWNFDAPENVTVRSVPTKFDWQKQLDQLRSKPFDRQATLALKSHFEEIGSKRLAAYMNGRLEGLKKE